MSISTASSTSKRQHLFFTNAKFPYGLALAGIILFALSWGVWSFFLGTGVSH